MSHLGAVAGAAAQPAHPPLPVASTGNVSADMDELQRVEARLLAERQEVRNVGHAHARILLYPAEPRIRLRARSTGLM